MGLLAADMHRVGIFVVFAALQLLCLASVTPLCSGEGLLPPRRRHRVSDAAGGGLKRGWRIPQGGNEVPKDPTVKADWYPEFPSCDKAPVSKLEYPIVPKDRSKCVQLPLSPEAERFTTTEAASQRPTVNSTFPGYLFILGTAYGGTTALLGLLSSSPKVVVPMEGWAHEGHWQLVKHNTFPFLKRSGMPYTVAMNVWEDLRYDKTVSLEETVKDLEGGWKPSPSQTIKVDKSHFLIKIADRLHPFYRAQGSVAKFIVLVRHPCTYNDQKRRLKQHLQKIREFKRFLEDHPEDALLVQYEEFVRDPELTAERILRFYPDLESLDPKVSNLSDKSTTLRNGNADRGVATGGDSNAELYRKYVTAKMESVGNMRQFDRSWCEGFPGSRKEISQKEGLELLRYFGWLE